MQFQACFYNIERDPTVKVFQAFTLIMLCSHDWLTDFELVVVGLGFIFLAREMHDLKILTTPTTLDHNHGVSWKTVVVYSLRS